MRRYIVLVFFLMTVFSFIQIKTYQSKEAFSGSYSGFVKDIKVSSKSYMVYVDDMVFSNFGEVTGVHLGDEVMISGRFLDVLTLKNSGFGNYLKGRGCSYIINSGDIQVLRYIDDGFSFRFSFLSWMDEKLDRLYGERSFFPKALLYGYTLDKDTLESFRLSGTSHILALSGFHVGFIILFLSLLLIPLGVNLRFAIICFCLILYAYITGARASIIRSTCFFLLYFLAFIKMRRFDTLCSVMLIASFMMAANPFIVYDIGFVLSFLCVASIFMFSPMLKRLALKVFITSPTGFWGYIFNLTIITIAAQILPLPYMAYIFGKIAMLSILANVLVLPLVSLLMCIIISSLLFSMFFPFARLLANLGSIIIDIILKINVFISNLSYSSKEVSLDFFPALIITVLLLLLFIGYENWRIQENKYDL